MAKQLVTNEQISRIVLDCLREGRSVEIDGLGVFALGDAGQFRFDARNGLRVFLAYVEEDKAQVIYGDLRGAGECGLFPVDGQEAFARRAELAPRH